MILFRKFIAAAVLCFSAMVKTAAAEINEAGAVAYYSNGPAIVGWNWLRYPGQYAYWQFQPVEGPVSEAVIVFSTLSANGKNGGAGFDSKLRIKGGQQGEVYLRNECTMLQYPENSRGIGYQSHGCIKVRLEPGVPLEIWVEYPGHGAHSAVNRATAKLIYVQ